MREKTNKKELEKDPYSEAKKLVEERNQQDVDAAGVKLQKAIEEIGREFGVGINFNVQITITKN